MLDVLPAEMARAYSDPRRVLKPESELPTQFGALCQRYSRFGGPRHEWVEYLQRPVCQEIWELAPECAAVATTAVA